MGCSVAFRIEQSTWKVEMEVTVALYPLVRNHTWRKGGFFWVFWYRTLPWHLKLRFLIHLRSKDIWQCSIYLLVVLGFFFLLFVFIQPREDMQPLLESLMEYKGILSTFPDVFSVSRVSHFCLQPFIDWTFAGMSPCLKTCSMCTACAF